MTAERAGGVILAIDSATTRVVVAAGTTGHELLDAAEWPDRLGPALPAERVDVIIDGSGDEPRSITVRAHGSGPRRYLEVVP